jgi:hypothetical protein
MNRHLAVGVVVVLCLGLFCNFSTLNDQAQAQGKVASAEQKITVLSPMGTPPPIKLKTMPPRLNTLEGKTIYFVDQGYLGSDNLLKEMVAWFEKNQPKTSVVFKRLPRGVRGTPGAQDPAAELWAEIKQKADAMVMGTGH